MRNISNSPQFGSIKMHESTQAVVL